MKKEIERKFLLIKYDRKLLKKGIDIEQGYMSLNPEIRIRISGQQGFLTIKSKGLKVRDEFEYRIPVRDAKRLLVLCRYRLKKTRYKAGRIEIDIYRGKLKGLKIAEIELTDADEPVSLPKGTIYEEITNDRRFRNQQLAKGMKRRKGEGERR